MRPAALYVHRSSTDGQWIFELPTVPQAAFMVSVVDEDADQPVWWLVSEAFTEVLRHAGVPVNYPSAAPAEADPAAYSEQLVARGIEPTALQAARASDRPLKSLAYGRVPRGFRQALPPLHQPEPLEPGRRYRITVLGGAGLVIGDASFSA